MQAHLFRIKAHAPKNDQNLVITIYLLCMQKHKLISEMREIEKEIINDDGGDAVSEGEDDVLGVDVIESTSHEVVPSELESL